MMRSARLLAAVIVGAFAVPQPSLAEESASRSPATIIPGGRPLFALPDLLVKVENMTTKCVGPNTLTADFDARVYNVGDGPAIMPKNTLGGGTWVRVRDMYGGGIDGYATAPPWYLLPGKTKSFFMSTKLTQVCKNGCSWVYTRLLLTADPFNWVLETSETNNDYDLPLAYNNKKGQSLCK